MVLKEGITSPAVLQMADFTKPFVLQIDASLVVLRVVLSQEVDGAISTVVFISRTLSQQDSKSCVYELEC